MQTLKESMNNDIKKLFLNNSEFAEQAEYFETGTQNPTQINVQFFIDSLDRLDTNYTHIWASYDDVQNINKMTSSFIIKGVTYGIIDFTVDEQQLGVDILLSER